MNNYKPLYEFIDKYEMMTGEWKPYLSYSDTTVEFVKTFHDSIEPFDYFAVIKGMDPIDTLVGKDLSCYSLEQLTAVLAAIILQERFNDGLLLEFLKNNVVLELLKAIKDKDTSSINDEV